MAFTPDHRTRSRNIHLQRQLNVTCNFLEKERQHFKKRHEEKQRECVLLYKRLQQDFKRFGVVPDHERPHTSAANSFREVRSRGFSDPLEYKEQLRRGSNSRPRSYSYEQECAEKSGCVKDTKVYKFERLNSSSPDTEAYTVYCHNPQRRLSSTSLASKIATQPSNSFSNYTSDVEWEDVKTISLYMNRSEKRDSLIDIRTPIVLRNIRPATVGAKVRSMSYSGPSQATLFESKYPGFRPRAATIGSNYLEARKRNRHVDILPNLPSALVPAYNQDIDKIEDNISQKEKSDDYSKMDSENGTDLEDCKTQTRPSPDIEKQLDEHPFQEEVSQSEEPNSVHETNMLNVPTIQRGRRRLSAPEIMSTKPRVARSSFEARKQRRFSQAKPVPRWTINEADDNDDSESDDLNVTDYDATNYVQKEVESFISNLKCSDAIETHVTSFKSTAKVQMELTVASEDKTTETKLQTPIGKTPVVEIGKGPIVPNHNQMVLRKKESLSVSNNKLMGLLKRPQMQFQMLVNKIKDANRAVERADRLKPKVKPPKCSF